MDYSAAASALLDWCEKRATAARCIGPAELDEELRSQEHSQPALVKGAAAQLGLALPPGLQATPSGLAEAVGYGREVRTHCFACMRRT